MDSSHESAFFRDIHTETTLIEGLLGETPQIVARIVDTNPDEIVLMTEEEFRVFVFDELYRRTQKGRTITEDYMIALRYIAGVVATLRTPMSTELYGITLPANMYVIDEMESGDFQRAGEHAIYGFIHHVGKRHNPLSKEDYINLAEMCFYRWYEKKPQSIGLIVARQVRTILDTMRNWRQDMMIRVPSYH